MSRRDDGRPAGEGREATHHDAGTDHGTASETRRLVLVVDQKPAISDGDDYVNDPRLGFTMR